MVFHSARASAWVSASVLVRRMVWVQARRSAAVRASWSQAWLMVKIIVRGEYDDAMNIGVFTGTEDEIRALVAELNESRKYVDPYDPEQVEQVQGSEYRYEESTQIRSAADVLSSTSPQVVGGEW